MSSFITLNLHVSYYHKRASSFLSAYPTLDTQVATSACEAREWLAISTYVWSRQIPEFKVHAALFGISSIPVVSRKPEVLESIADLLHAYLGQDMPILVTDPENFFKAAFRDVAIARRA